MGLDSTCKSKARWNNVKGGTAPASRFCGSTPPPTAVEGFITTGREYAGTRRSLGPSRLLCLLVPYALLSPNFLPNICDGEGRALGRQMCAHRHLRLPQVSSSMWGTRPSWFDGVHLTEWFGALGWYQSWWKLKWKTLGSVPASCAFFHKDCLSRIFLACLSPLMFRLEHSIHKKKRFF